MRLPLRSDYYGCRTRCRFVDAADESARTRHGNDSTRLLRAALVFFPERTNWSDRVIIVSHADDFIITTRKTNMWTQTEIPPPPPQPRFPSIRSMNGKESRAIIFVSTDDVSELPGGPGRVRHKTIKTKAIAIKTRDKIDWLRWRLCPTITES